MKDSSIKQIKTTQFNIFQLILTTVLIASGVNFLVTGAISYFENKSGLLFVIIGISLILLTLIITLIIDFKKSKIREIINAIITYDPQDQELIKIPKYILSEDLTHYLKAARIESKDIESLWKKDKLGFKRIYNDIDPKSTFVEISQSAAILNKLVEYLILKKLSLITVDYFNKPTFDKRKLIQLTELNLPDMVVSNMFLSLFSKDISQRVAFDNIENKRVVKAYGKNGEIYDRFELSLPKKCQIFRKKPNTIILKHPLFKLELTPAFSGFSAVLPRGFTQEYIKADVFTMRTYKFYIGVTLKFSWKSLFIGKSIYYDWIDNFLDKLHNDMDFDRFIEDINWNIVSTLNQCNKEKNWGTKVKRSDKWLTKKSNIMFHNVY